MTVILGIETSCDETSVAIVADGKTILSNTVRTQHIHSQFGGVVPDISFREHADYIDTVFASAIEQSGLNISDIDAIAVVNGPGLVGSLMAGVMFAKGLSMRLNKPIITIDHIKAHIFGNFFNNNIEFPFIALVASGGHSTLMQVQEGFDTTVIGKTLDDAAGEAFDKCAKMMGLEYPGGPEIDRIGYSGNNKFHKFPRADAGDFNFSFSGLKTSVLYYLKGKEIEFIESHKSDIAASLQEAIIDQLIIKTLKAAESLKISRIALAGGVAANRKLREKMQLTLNKNGIQFFMPAIEYCTDNAANTAGLAFSKYKRNSFADMDFDIYSRNQ